MKETYSKARNRLFAELESKGWTIKRELKIPHVTSPSGKTRAWFKKQAVHSARSFSGNPSYPLALSLFIDIRDLSVEEFCYHVEN